MIVLCRFVSMDTEEDAKDTLIDLRLKKRTFRGAAVKARIKTETVIRSYYPLPSAPVIPAGFPAYPVANMPLDLRQFGYALPVPIEGVIVDATGAPVVPDVKASSEETKNTTTGNSSNSNSKPSNSGNKDNRGADNSKKGGAAQSGNKSAPSNNSNNSSNRKTDGGNARNTKGGAAGGNRKDHEAARPHIEINSANFPPLSSDDTPVPTPGYKDAFVKYSFEEIITIVKEVKEATLPASLNPVSDISYCLYFCLTSISPTTPTL